MSNKAINTLGYTGIVTLSRIAGNKKTKIAQLHNTGASPLFDFLANCLVGDFALAKALRPTKIILLDKIIDTDTNKETYEKASDFIHLLNPPTIRDSNGQSRVLYSFAISKDVLASVTSFDNLWLGLYAQNETDIEKFSACCELGFSKNAVADASIVVDWELTISNISNME